MKHAKLVVTGLLLFTIIFFGMAVSVQAQTNELFTVHGRVFDTDKTPLDGVEVIVTDMNTGDTISNVTSMGGWYSVNLANMVHNTSATDIIKVSATFEGKTDSKSFTRGPVSNSPKRVDLVLQLITTPTPTVTPTPTPTVTPTPTPYYKGGGGGGAAAPAVGAGVTSVSTEPTTGEVKTSVTAKSADAKAAATITAGTIAKDAAGKPLTMITITPPSVLPAAPPAGVSYVGYAYNFGPEGATFEPAIEISIEFDPAKFEGKTPVIYTYEAGKWVKLDTRIEDNKAIAKVDHFSTFVLFGEEKVVITPTPTPTATLTMPPVSPTPSPTPTPTPKPGIPGYEAVFAIAGLLAVAYLVLRRKA